MTGGAVKSCRLLTLYIYFFKGRAYLIAINLDQRRRDVSRGTDFMHVHASEEGRAWRDVGAILEEEEGERTAEKVALNSRVRRRHDKCFS